MSISYLKDQNDVVTLTFDRANRSVNVIDQTFLASLRQAVGKLEDESCLRGVILTSAKETFLAGGDLESLLQLEDAEQAFQLAESVKDLFRHLELLGQPVVAAINGSALGGGLELALATHYRIAVNANELKLGFPEVSLGLLPGGGGVTRMTRMLGLQKAFPYLVEGRLVTPQTAQEDGLVDELAADHDELISRAHKWILGDPQPVQPWDDARHQIPGGAPDSPRLAPILAVAPASLKKKTFGNYPAPEAVLSAMVEGAAVDFATASRIESRYFAHVATGRVAKNMIGTFWFQLNDLKSGKSRPSGVPAMRTRKVGVLGAGMMGHGIAYASAAAGLSVVLKDISLEKAEYGKDLIAAILDKRASRGRISPIEKEEILQRIHATDQIDDLEGCDLVVEAVFEDRALKANVIAQTDRRLANAALLASNTSTLPITSLAQYTSHPDNFIGLHFFSPVHKMKLVEIIRGQQTSAAALAKAFDFVLQIGKIPIVVNDSRGFYTSRVVAAYLKEGLALLQEGQHPRAIESAGVQAGMPVGPLALADEVSLGLMWAIHQQTVADLTAEGKSPPPHPADDVLALMIQDCDRRGKAYGAGFYEYPPAKPKYLWPRLPSLFSPPERKLTLQEMMERLMFIQAIETSRCFEEGVLRSVADANIGSIYGWGFAPFKGGTLQYINDYGLPQFVTRSRQMARSYGTRFEPPALLQEMSRSGIAF